MKPRWEMVTCWKYDLATEEEDSFEYFNEEAFIPGHIYRIHVSNGAPIIVEFKHFGCGYDHSMTKTYPRVLMCDGAADVHIKNITHIFAYNGDDEEDASSTSTESTKTTVDVSGFKDFVVSKNSYHVNKILNDIKPAVLLSSLTSDKINISGELKITGIDIAIHYSSFLHTQCVRIELPTGDEITIPASDHPWVETSDGQNFPVFIEDKSELSWNKDLAAGEFYIMLNEFDDKKPILIKNIYTDKIEYVSWYSRYDRNNLTYFVEGITYELKIEDAKDRKFIPVKDVQ